MVRKETRLVLKILQPQPTANATAAIQQDLLADAALMPYWRIPDTLIIVPSESGRSPVGVKHPSGVADVNRRRLNARFWVTDIVYSLISWTAQHFISIWKAPHSEADYNKWGVTSLQSVLMGAFDARAGCFDLQTFPKSTVYMQIAEDWRAATFSNLLSIVLNMCPTSSAHFAFVWKNTFRT